jgi:hypothetical protein
MQGLGLSAVCRRTVGAQPLSGLRPSVWVVLGGDSPDALWPLGSQPRSGFETAIQVPGRPLLVAVRALDSSGATLGQSSPIRT